MHKLIHLSPMFAMFLVLNACSPIPTQVGVDSTSMPISVESATPMVAATVFPSPTLTVAAVPAHLQQIHFTSPLEGWGVGTDGNASRLLKTTDGGKTWADVSTAVIGDIQNEPDGSLVAAFLGNEHIWLVRSVWPGMPNVDAKVVFSSDGGASWSESTSLDQTDQFESFSVSQLFFMDEQTGWLLAHVGAGMNHDYIVLYQTIDGGLSWEQLISPFEDSSGIQSCQKNGLWFADASHGWLTGSCNGVAAGVLLFRTEDGGRHWKPIQLPVPDGYADLFGMGSGYCGSNPIRQGNGSTLEVEVACRQVTPIEDTLFFNAITLDHGDSWTISQVDRTRQYRYGKDALQQIDLGSIWRWSDDGGMSWQDSLLQSEWPGYGISLETPDIKNWITLTWSENGTNLAFSVDQGKSWKVLNPLRIDP